jgi:predicted amidophosphoribosyltransferase
MRGDDIEHGEGAQFRDEASRRERRTTSGASRRLALLRGLERTLLGSRMPTVESVRAAAGWRREPIAEACRRCGATRVPFESIDGGCGECRGRSMSIAATVRLGGYAPPLSRWAPAVKSHAWRDMARMLGVELGRQVADAVEARRLRMPHVVVPVPVHWSRRCLRGIDHAGQIAEAVAREIDRPCIRAVAARCASRQSGRGRAARAANDGRFAIDARSDATILVRLGRRMLRGASYGRRGPGDSDFPLKGMDVLIVDDVRTTGTTSEEVGRLLLQGGAGSVSLAVCAVADAPRRASLRTRNPANRSESGCAPRSAE